MRGPHQTHDKSTPHT